MKICVYQIDTFTDKIFSGNPAAVCVLDHWLDDLLLQKIAAEINLPATAFIYQKNEAYEIRWFTPEYEIDLCGHGTLAAGYVIFKIIDNKMTNVILQHPKAGKLTLHYKNNMIYLHFPIKEMTAVHNENGLANEAFNATPIEVYEYKDERLIAVFADEQEIMGLRPNLAILKEIPYRGVIVTAKSKNYDFVSRVFYPKKAIYEDAVTGSSYCFLAPYWGQKLNKNNFKAKQLSQRGGEVECTLLDNGIELCGKAVLFSKGEIIIEY